MSYMSLKSYHRLRTAKRPASQLQVRNRSVSQNRSLILFNPNNSTIMPRGKHVMSLPNLVARLSKSRILHKLSQEPDLNNFVAGLIRSSGPRTNRSGSFVVSCLLLSSLDEVHVVAQSGTTGSRGFSIGIESTRCMYNRAISQSTANPIFSIIESEKDRLPGLFTYGGRDPKSRLQLPNQPPV